MLHYYFLYTADHRCLLLFTFYLIISIITAKLSAGNHFNCIKAATA